VTISKPGDGYVTVRALGVDVGRRLKPNLTTKSPRLVALGSMRSRCATRSIESNLPPKFIVDAGHDDVELSLHVERIDDDAGLAAVQPLKPR
jgi:hypothetical protein